MENLQFTTENGTVYQIRDGFWYRMSRTDRSGKTRNESREIVGEPYIHLGHSAYLNDTDSGIVTSPVVKIELLEVDNVHG